eukprot:1897042-Prymnesium_polylepis.1
MDGRPDCARAREGCGEHAGAALPRRDGSRPGDGARLQPWAAALRVGAAHVGRRIRRALEAN